MGIGVGLVAASPTSTNFTLKAYDFGNGGGNGSSTNYSVNGTTNGQSGDQASSGTYKLSPGLSSTQNANVPPAPTFLNTDASDVHLKLTLNTGSNPTNTTYAIAISTNNFTTTNYVQSDTSIGPALGSEDRQSYAAWGGASGFFVTGLSPSTSYTVKVKAYQGRYSESAYGPTATASTGTATLSFSVATSLTSTPPFAVSFANLANGSVFAANATVNLAISSSASSGGTIYVKDLYGGLRSSASGNYTLTSATADLGSASKGYGAQISSVTQTSGGPLSASSPFSGVSNNVGAITTSLQPILSTSSQISNGTATVTLRAKTDITVPSSNDYTDTLTFVAAMNF